jgi:hypothetical protein
MKCVLNLFDRLEHIDVECVDLLTEWFAHYLANFDFKWLWYVCVVS